ncbi:heparanase [Patella vulgata]|uniref:heparanase n=1 Tax=Patella vulgata TaxID=6465 RepID=UPI0024A95840|nr:heparanase [Patella vulgata]
MGSPKFLTLAKGLAPNFLRVGGTDCDFLIYYMSSASATVEKFHSVTVLESLRPMLINVINLCKRFIPTKQVWLGETSSSYGGGAHEISDRYVASFLWLDKLGLSSVLGIQGVLRQTFYGGNYGLINSNLDPNPDYWLTLLFKRLVASPVFTVPQPPNPDLRIYAHCTNTNSSMGYTKGSVTLYLLNLGNMTLPVDVPDMVNKTHHIYMFSPGDDSGLTSKSIKLNGVVLALANENELPPLEPVIGQDNIQVDAYNMGYIVFPGAMRPECV